MHREKIAIIVLVYNNQNELFDCFDSLYQNLDDNLFESQIFLFDNHSEAKTQEKIEKLRATYPKIKIFKNDINLGFARAINQAVSKIKEVFNPDYYFLLNPDARLEKECLKKLFCHAQENPSIGLISPLILTQEKKIWFAGGRINWFKMKAHHEQNLRKIDYLSGCALWLKKSVFEKIGLFDEKFFLYYEDADFSWRAQKAGFHLKVLESAFAYHDESKSSCFEQKNYHLVKSGLFFFFKHFSKPFYAYFWLIFGLRFFYHKFFTRKEIVLKAMKNFLKIIHSKSN